MGSEAEGDRELIWRPDEVKAYLRKFFEAWMGKVIKLWFNSCGAGGDELHPYFDRRWKGDTLGEAW